MSLAWIAVVLVVVIGLSWMVAKLFPRDRGLRCGTVAAVLLLCLAASGVRVETGAGGDAFLLIDVSASTGLPPPDPGGWMARLAVDPDRCRVLVFGESPVWLSAVPGRLDRDSTAGAALAGRGGSDLAAALRDVAGVVGPGDEVIVLTDGRQWWNGLNTAAAAVRGSGAGIRVEPFGRARGYDMRVAALRAPSRIPTGSGVTLEVLVEGPPGGRGTVEIRVDGVRWRRVEFGLGVSGRERLTVGIPGLERGYRTIEAGLWPASADSIPGNDRSATGVVVGSRRRAVLLRAAELRPALEKAGFAVTDQAVLDSPAHYDLVVLGNVRAAELPSSGQGVLDYVRAGGGLLVLGGPDAFGPGGYSGRPLGECLPVRSRPEGEGLRLILLMDASGSMNRPFFEGEAVPKAKMARDATLTLAEALPDGTDVIVVPFSARILEEPKRMRAGEEGFLVELRRALEPGGADRSSETRFDPPLRWALGAVGQDGASKSLVLLVTDGQVVGDESEEELIALARGVAAAPGRVLLHVLAVGRDADESFLRRLAGSAESFTVVRSGGELAGGLMAALLGAEGDGLVLTGESEAVDRQVPGAPLEGPLPAVTGLVRTWARSGAAVWYATRDGDPLIAGWRYGLGKVVAVTTDPLGPWANSWSGTPALLALSDHVARSAGMGGRRVSVVAVEDKVRVSVYCEEARATLGGQLLTSDGRLTPVDLTAAGDGLLTCEWKRAASGAARLTLADGLFDGGLSIPYPPEYSASGPDSEGIRRLRALLGNAPDRGGAATPIGHWIALLAVGVFLLDRFFRPTGR